MSSLHYKTLLANLPSMAAVVNSFDSPEVQRAVFDVLIDSFQQRLANELASTNGSSSSQSVSSRTAQPTDEAQDLTHELVDGESIHSFSDDE